MNVNTFKDYVKVAAMGEKPFFADEVNVSGGSMATLHRYGMVKPTGVTKQVTIQSYPEDKPFTVEAKQWVVVLNCNRWGNGPWWLSHSGYERSRASRVASELLQNLEALQVIAAMLD